MVTSFSLSSNSLLADEAAPGAVVQPAQVEAKPFDEEARKSASYLMGYQSGYNLQRMLMQQNMIGVTLQDLNEDAVIQGLKDAIEGLDPGVDQQEAMAAVQSMQQVIGERTGKLVEENKAKGQAYRESRMDEDGMQTTESGLMYKVVKQGEGATYEVPEGAGRVDMQTKFKLKYEGRLIDGTVFDSSEGETREFDLRVVEGFAEALKMMPEGSTYEVILKSDLAYKDSSPTPKIAPGSTLIFEITLDEIIKPEPAPAGGGPGAGAPRSAVTPPIPIPRPEKKEEAKD